MPTPQQMIESIRGFGRAELLDLYDQIGSGQEPAFWNEGMALEHLTHRAFQLEGVEVQWPYRVPMPASETTMEQIDGVLYVDTLAVLVETKDTEQPQNVEPIAKLKSQLDRRPPQTLGLVVSRTGFTIPAATLTQFISGGRIILWRGDELRYALAGTQMVSAFRRKYRHLVERAMPDLIIIPPEPLQPPDPLAEGPADGPDVPG